jgi:hypothetical protein
LNLLFCLSSSCVLCAQYYQCLCVVHSWFAPSVLFDFLLCLVCPILPVSLLSILDCTFCFHWRLCIKHPVMFQMFHSYSERQQVQQYLRNIWNFKPGYISITCSKISKVPYNLITTTKFNDSSILITIISCDYLNLSLANEYVDDVTIPTQVIKYNQTILQADQPIRLQYSNKIKLYI